MTRDEYIKAVNVIIQHDETLKRIHDVSHDLAREVGDDFGGIALNPETPLRRAYIETIKKSSDDTCEESHLDYFLDEARHMPNGGLVTLKSGKNFTVKTAGDCWDLIQADNLENGKP